MDAKASTGTRLLSVYHPADGWLLEGAKPYTAHKLAVEVGGLVYEELEGNQRQFVAHFKGHARGICFGIPRKFLGDLFEHTHRRPHHRTTPPRSAVRAPMAGRDWRVFDKFTGAEAVISDIRDVQAFAAQRPSFVYVWGRPGVAMDTPFEVGELDWSCVSYSAESWLVAMRRRYHTMLNALEGDVWRDTNTYQPEFDDEGFPVGYKYLALRDRMLYSPRGYGQIEWRDNYLKADREPTDTNSNGIYAAKTWDAQLLLSYMHTYTEGYNSRFEQGRLVRMRMHHPVIETERTWRAAAATITHIFNELEEQWTEAK